MKIIDLCSLDEKMGVIVSFKTGIYFSNQSGGYACKHPQIEGFYFPINHNEKQYDSLCNYFVGSKYNGWCCNGINKRDLRFINNLLAQNSCWATLPITVDTDKLKESMEAWIYIDIARNNDLMEGFTGIQKGVLVWQNSD